MNRWMDGQVDELLDRWDEQIHEERDNQIDKLIDGQMNKWLWD